MSESLSRYRQGEEALPESYWLLPLYGQGLENLGPVKQVPLPRYGPDQLLVRHDACGICFSDVKILRAGGEHPRLTGRDLRNDPVVPGHEVALTVVGVGEALHGQFSVGQRFAVQADVYYQGKNLAYGYMLQGGLSQYSVLGDEVLRGDHGCYLIPVQSETGYAQAALTEPWACVEAAYDIAYRDSLKPGGVTWLMGSFAPPGRPFALSQGLDPQAHPALLLLTDVPQPLQSLLKTQANALNMAVVDLDGLQPTEYQAGVAGAIGAQGIENLVGVDDLVILGPANAEAIAQAFRTLAPAGILNLVSDNPLPSPATIDAGWLHYDHIAIVGSAGPDIAASYRPIRSRLQQGGQLWLMGAAGPMGHMHLQRAIEVGPAPSRIVATNFSSPRIDELAERFGPAAADRGIELTCFSQASMTLQAFRRKLLTLTEERGFDDIVILAPSIPAVQMAVDMLAGNGVLNLFAGMKRGTDVQLDLNPFVDSRQVRLVGSSGSSIEHMTRMLQLTEQGRLSTNRSVAAVAGLKGARDAIEAVSEGRFSGKVVVYPHLTELELIPLPALRERLPAVHDKLGPDHLWTQAAEKQLLGDLL